MIWLYMNGAGDITCQVNVGNKIRQGNAFDAFLVIEGMQDEPPTNSLVPTGVSYLPAGSDQFINFDAGFEGLSIQTFTLDDPSKVNFAFKGGISYKGYLFHLPIQSTTFTANGGHCYLLFRLTDGVNNEYSQKFSFFVEPTFGKTPSLLTLDDFATLTALIRSTSSGDYILPIEYNTYRAALGAIKNAILTDENTELKTIKAQWNNGSDSGELAIAAWNSDATSLAGYIMGTHWSPDYAYFNLVDDVWEVTLMGEKYVELAQYEAETQHATNQDIDDLF